MQSRVSGYPRQRSRAGLDQGLRFWRQKQSLSALNFLKHDHERLVVAALKLSHYVCMRGSSGIDMIRVSGLRKMKFQSTFKHRLEATNSYSLVYKVDLLSTVREIRKQFTFSSFSIPMLSGFFNVCMDGFN